MYKEDSRKRTNAFEEYRNRKDYEMSRKIWSIQRKEKFHIITCQFAYHYMWESKYHLQSFMSNVEDHLVDGVFYCYLFRWTKDFQ